MCTLDGNTTFEGGVNIIGNNKHTLTYTPTFISEEQNKTHNRALYGY